MVFKCPGQDNRNIKTEEIGCFTCGYKIEFFSDEIKRFCPRCKRPVFKNRIANCIDWCKYAKECVGEARLQSLKKGLIC